MDLRQIVERYATLAGNFGEPITLEAFGLNQQETEKVFSGLDEDYHISRFLQFSSREGLPYRINGQSVTHVAVDPAIHSLF